MALQSPILHCGSAAVEQETGESREETDSPLDSALSPFAYGLRSPHHFLLR